jgi:aminopeptidase YwaD
MRIAEQLSKVIGVRVSGTPKEAQAAQFVASEFRKLGFETSIQEFRYLGWKQLGKPSLSVISPFQMRVKASTMAYTGTTPKGGIEGALRYHGTFYLFPKLMELPKYTVIDNKGDISGFVLVTPGDQSRAMPNPWLQIFQDPAVLVCEKEFLPIFKAIHSGKEVRVRLKSVARYIQSNTSFNVIARMEGKKEEVIIVGGHHDSMVDSPGATDNAAGVEAIFHVANRLLKKKRNFSYYFITWGGHEWGLFGSQYFAREAKETGLIRQLKACLTLDVLGCGDYLWIWAGPQGFRKKIEGILKTTLLTEKRDVKFEGELIGSDDWSFAGEDIPHAMLMDWPADNLHLPTDEYEALDESKIKFGVEVTMSLLEHFEKHGFP